MNHIGYGKQCEIHSTESTLSEQLANYLNLPSPHSPSTSQVSGIAHPMGSRGPGQLVNPSPQSMGGKDGHWVEELPPPMGQSTPMATQRSGIEHPMGSAGPGQLTIPSPQSMGGRTGQGAGTARAEEKKVKSRRDMVTPALLNSSGSPRLVFIPLCHMWLFALLIVAFVLDFIRHLCIFTASLSVRFKSISPGGWTILNFYLRFLHCFRSLLIPNDNGEVWLKVPHVTLKFYMWDKTYIL